MKQAKAIELLVRLRDNWPHERFTPSRETLWLKELILLDEEAAEAAVVKYIRSYTTFPTIAAIREWADDEAQYPAIEPLARATSEQVAEIKRYVAGKREEWERAPGGE